MRVDTNYGAQQTYGTSQSQRTGASERTGNDYLKELRERHPNANISVGDVGVGGIEGYAWGQVGKTNGVLIHPDALDKFANDPEAAAKMESELKEFIDSEQSSKDYFDSLGMKLLGRGMVVDENGETRFWCLTQSSSEKDDEEGKSLLEKLMPKKNEKDDDKALKRAKDKKEAEKAAEKKAEEKREEKRAELEELVESVAQKTVFASGSSFSELADNAVNRLADSSFIDRSV